MSEEGNRISVPKKVRGYEVQRLLGKGGMGEVFLATHATLDRPVALKRLAMPATTKDEKTARERFLREGKALARLHHQGIIAVHDLFEFQDDLYMVLEYVDGCDLAVLLEDGPLPLDVTCLVGLGLAEALEYAHFHGIIHRDIKASNVMISRSGEVKLMDFGIAKGSLLDKITKPGILVGTPKYIAPEALLSREQNAQSDLYGLGAVLYHCLSGKRLFYHVEGQELYKAITAGRYVSLNDIASHIPRDLRSIVHRCLRRNPTERYSSAGEVRRDIDLFMAHERMWLKRAERLQGFLEDSEDAPADLPMPDPQFSDALTPNRQRLNQRIMLAVIGLIFTGLGALIYWGLTHLI